MDAEVAQVQGLGDWLVKQNNPEESGITSRDPNELIPLVLKICTVHFAQYVLNYSKDFNQVFNHITPETSKNFPPRQFHVRKKTDSRAS